MVIQYVDDITICSPDRETCHVDSVKLLQVLAQKDHKVSQKKLQYVQEQVIFTWDNLQLRDIGAFQTVTWKLFEERQSLGQSEK